MSKSHVEELEQVYRCLFQDIRYAYPELQGELGKDLVRLARLQRDRGIHLYVVDLPNAGKHFDRCLATGEYTVSGLPLTKRSSPRSVIPKFLRGLLRLIFSDDGRLKADADVQAVFFVRQIYLCAKKAELPSSDSDIFNAVEEMIAIDQALPEPAKFWECLSPTIADIDLVGFADDDYYQQKIRERSPTSQSYYERLLWYMDIICPYITTTLGSYDPSEWSFRHGPGAVSEKSGFPDKYSWQFWPDRLDHTFPIADYGYHNYAAWAHGSDTVSTDECPSRLIAVRKTYKKPRLIAAEPTANQWCQQNMWHYISRRVSQSWISNFIRFRDQSRNQELCLYGSYTGSLCTIDLSSASDRVTCHLVGKVFRANPRFLLAMQACRTRTLKQTMFNNLPEVIVLKKFSTMGSALTFPVQSLIFLSVALSTILLVRGKYPTPKEVQALAEEVSIFGDDIIIPNDIRGSLGDSLEFFDFKVNDNKSFSEGNFRESCGVDAFRGEDVTPTYWKAPPRSNPESIASTLEVSRNFYKKFLLNTSNYVASTIPRDFPLVPFDSDVRALPSFVRPSIESFETRWNAMLQRLEIRLPRFISRPRTEERQDDSALHQYFTDSPSPFVEWRSGIPQGSATKLRSGWVDSGEIQLSD